MAWSDEPTYAQLNTIYRWISWEMSMEKAREAVAWLKANRSRGDVSDEMKRLKELKDNRQLNYEQCFVGKIWDGYDHE